MEFGNRTKLKSNERVREKKREIWIVTITLIECVRFVENKQSNDIQKYLTASLFDTINCPNGLKWNGIIVHAWKKKPKSIIKYGGKHLFTALYKISNNCVHLNVKYNCAMLYYKSRLTVRYQNTKHHDT